MPNADARDKVIESLNRSKVYEKLAELVTVFAEPVTDWQGLMGYLLKEATPQAAYRRDIRRVGGSIPLARARWEPRHPLRGLVRHSCPHWTGAAL